MSLNRYRLRHQANNGNKAAQRTARLLENPDRLISLILLGNNFVNILASLIILVFAEVTPKTFATRRAEQFAFIASAVYGPLMIITYPLVVATNWISSRILKLLNTEGISANQEDLSSEELRTVLNETAGMIPQRHRDMLLNILDLGTVSVNDIMVPRNEVVGIDLEDPWDDVVREIGNSEHSRLLVYRENVDNAVGFIYLRKMLDALRSGKITKQYLESVIRDPYFIPEGTTLTVQLLNFQQEKRRIGLVVDEYGDIQGLLTLEDILEEIVGEFDNDPHDAPAEIQPQDDGSFIVDGATQVRNLNKSLNWSLPSEGPKTLNGIVIEHFENFPLQGAVFTFNGHPMTILAVEDNKVQQVRIEPAQFDEQGDDATAAAGA